MKTSILVVTLSIAALAACGSSENVAAATAPSGKAATAAQAPAAPAPPPPPFEYPAPVKGEYEESDMGKFALVDGLAYTAGASRGTVVYVSDKALASPVLATSTCPMTQARAIRLIRDGKWLEVTIDGKGRSNYFGSGTIYDGQGRETETKANAYWTITGGQVTGGRIAGNVTYRGRGGFDFDLPVLKPKVTEVSEGDKVQTNRYDASRREPTEAELLKAYSEMRKAALAKDLKLMLELQGFDAKQVQAIRGLPGIDGELAAHADRFLDPGEPEEQRVEGGYGGVGGKGKNSKGEAFFNFYEFTPCGNKLLLTSIGLNPQ